MEFDQYTPEPEAAREAPEGRPLWPWAVALLVIVLGVAAYLLFREGEPPPPTAAGPPAPAAEEPAEEPTVEPGELPRLAASDDWLRNVVAEVSSHPDLARWLLSDNLVRRFTAVVDNVARGESPRPHLGFLDPAEDFEVVERGGAIYADPDSYERYDRLAEVIDSVDADGAARLYERIKPLLQKGYADLGYPNRDFDDALTRALRHLLATPLPDKQPRLEPGIESFTYRDPQLENLSPAQKHLLRTGPDNAAAILDKLREIAERLDLPVG
jgi:hypothetical protein